MAVGESSPVKPGRSKASQFQSCGDRSPVLLLACSQSLSDGEAAVGLRASLSRETRDAFSWPPPCEAERKVGEFPQDRNTGSRFVAVRKQVPREHGNPQK